MSDVGTILIRLEALLGTPIDGPVPLDGGITNRNYRVRYESGEYVLRLPGKDTALLGIDRRAERMAAERAAALGIGPELVYADDECVLTAFLEARPLEPGELSGDPAGVARALRRFHDSGLQLPCRFWIPELLSEYESLLRRHGRAVPAMLVEAQEAVARVADVLPLDAPVACHDDLLPGNLLVTSGGIQLVDWEYAGMGHRYFDLGNLAVNNELDEAAEEQVLEAYWDAPVTGGRRAALRLMRIVSDARESAWGIVQGLISELDFDFAGYATQHYDRMRQAAADPRLEEWLNAAAA